MRGMKENENESTHGRILLQSRKNTGCKEWNCLSTVKNKKHCVLLFL
jgi:hypothetical protein